MIKLPGGTGLSVGSYKNAMLSLTIELQNTFFVPEFTCNLASINKLTHQLNCSATFFPSFYVLQYLTTRNLIGKGEMVDGLYYFNKLNIPLIATTKPNTSPEVQHQCLGHIPLDKLASISFFSHLSFNKVNKCCNTCHKARQTRLPFFLSNNISNSSFSLVHMDV